MFCGSVGKNTLQSALDKTAPFESTSSGREHERGKLQRERKLRKRQGSKLSQKILRFSEKLKRSRRM